MRLAGHGLGFETGMASERSVDRQNPEQGARIAMGRLLAIEVAAFPAGCPRG
jgi:hypothetical protein